MIGLLATGFMKLGAGAKLAKGLAWGAIALAAVIVVLVVVDKIGDARENKLRLETAEQTIENRGIADTADAGLESADDADDQALEDTIDEAVDEDPEAAARPAGRVSNAVARELRNQRRRSGDSQ